MLPFIFCLCVFFLQIPHHTDIEVFAFLIFSFFDHPHARFQVSLPDTSVDLLAFWFFADMLDDSGGQVVILLDQFLAVWLLHQVGVPVSPEHLQLVAVIRLPEGLADGRGDIAGFSFEPFHDPGIIRNIHIRFGEVLLPCPVDPFRQGPGGLSTVFQNSRKHIGCQGEIQIQQVTRCGK